MVQQLFLEAQMSRSDKWFLNVLLAGAVYMVLYSLYWIFTNDHPSWTEFAKQILAMSVWFGMLCVVIYLRPAEDPVRKYCSKIWYTCDKA